MGDETPKTLAMIKMEKNFVAVIQKGYPRKPYLILPVKYLIDRARQELDELQDSVEKGDVKNALQECGDVSNIIDYIFERLSRGRKQ